ncbi:MAG: hypothetical protein ACTTKZ_01640 [Bacteroides sp.]
MKEQEEIAINVGRTVFRFKRGDAGVVELTEHAAEILNKRLYAYLHNPDFLVRVRSFITEDEVRLSDEEIAISYLALNLMIEQLRDEKAWGQTNPLARIEELEHRLVEELENKVS